MASPLGFLGFLMKWKLDSKRECSKRQEVKVSLPSPGARIYHPAVTAIIFYWSKESKSPPKIQGEEIQTFSLSEWSGKALVSIFNPLCGMESHKSENH